MEDLILKRLLTIGSVMVKVNTCPHEMKTFMIYLFSLLFLSFCLFMALAVYFKVICRTSNKLMCINDFISYSFCVIMFKGANHNS